MLTPIVGRRHRPSSLGLRHAIEFPADAGALQEADLQSTLLGWRLLITGQQTLTADGQRFRQRQVLAVMVLQVDADTIGLPANDRKLLVIGNRAIKGDVIHLIFCRGLTHFHHQNFHFQWLGVAGENSANGLGIGIGQRLRGDILAAIGIAFEIRITNAGFAEIFELAIFPNASKSNAIVDLGNFVERGTRIFRHQEQSPRHTPPPRSSALWRCLYAHTQPYPA